MFHREHHEDQIDALFAELSLVSILENYLNDSDWVNDKEEDIVLAALAVLAEDDRQSRGLDVDERHQSSKSLMGNIGRGALAALAAASEAAQAATESSLESLEMLGDTVMSVGGHSLMKYSTPTQ
jgi:hypothetical protein